MIYGRRIKLRSESLFGGKGSGASGEVSWEPEEPEGQNPADPKTPISKMKSFLTGVFAGPT